MIFFKKKRKSWNSKEVQLFRFFLKKISKNQFFTGNRLPGLEMHGNHYRYKGILVPRTVPKCGKCGSFMNFAKKRKFWNSWKICENLKFHDFLSKWAPGRKTYINISISIGFWGPETVIFLEFTTFGGFYDISHLFQKKWGNPGNVRKCPLCRPRAENI